jgi:hypothetical protein
MSDSNQTEKSKISELTAKELDALITRLEEAIEFDLALSNDDIRLLLSALLTLATMQESLSNKKITLHKLRKLVGMVQSSEKLSDLVNEKPSVNKHKVPRKKKPKKKNSVSPVKIHHKLKTLNKGDTCPECERGSVYRYEPAQLLRVAGHSPFTPELHLSERLRCNTCGQFFTAPLPDDVLADGDSDQKYGYSARSLMAINKYFAGTPFYRQESLQSLLGFSVSASTIFDQCEYVANHLQPIFKVMKAQAANAVHFYLDDTTHRILEQAPIEKKKRNSQVMQKRTGIYASGIIASTKDQDIVLFQTNIGHAGEFIDELLKLRPPDRPRPILMSDALASNNPTVTPVFQGACNSHARRNFVDVISQFPQEVEWVLKRYKLIWVHDDYSSKQPLNDTQRLAYHKQHSLPVMQEIHAWGIKHFKDMTLEENSSLGKAIAYFNNHFERLTLFCRMEGAKIDNNYMEAMLKLIVRNRKNAYFYKTLAGASISDVITSFIATSMQADVNVFDYFNAVQRNHQAVKESPADWMPWNYLSHR